MTQAQPEPSMEEILASIRRIISDDGEEEGQTPPAAQQTIRPRPTPVAATPAASTAAAAPSPARPSFLKREEAAPARAARADEDRAETHLKTEDVEMIKKSAAAETDVVLDEAAAAAAAKAFQNLSQSVRVSRAEGRTLEDIVVDLVRPLVKEWLDQNLAQIVEDKVEAEVQRVARQRR
ncbi:MAG: DUF2497 domain-containing protein [Parvularculaceae bacterium]|nr:DUF2497 domain-containing protein [Parvularculaceae bacterium]